MVYEGMNSEYYIGMKLPYYRDTADCSSSKVEEVTEPQTDSPSGSSSHTAVSTMLGCPENTSFDLHHYTIPQRYGSRDIDAPLPIRRRQRKPDRRSKPYDMEDISSAAAKKKSVAKRGRPAAGPKPKRAIAAGEEGLAQGPAFPKQPLPPRELPARHTPRKKWQDEEIWEAPRRSRSGQYAEAALASPVRRTKSTAVPKRQPASPSTKGLQKDGGPCAVCFVTKSATWRRGALGGRNSGAPLCNKCGVWEFRHPESPARDEAELEFASNRRRNSSHNTGRRYVRLSRRSSDEDDFNRSFSAEANLGPQHPPPQAEPTMFRSFSDNMQPMQQWASNNVVARVVPNLQHVQHAVPVSSQDAQVGNAAVGLQESAAEGAAATAEVKCEPLFGQTGNKRRGDELYKPVAKRWHIEANAGGMAASPADSQINDVKENSDAAVDLFDCGKEKTVTMAQPLRHRVTLRVKMPVKPTADEQQQSDLNLV